MPTQTKPCKLRTCYWHDSQWRVKRKAGCGSRASPVGGRLILLGRPVFKQKHRTSATLKDDEEVSKRGTLDIEAETFPFQLPKPPKFQPFVGESGVAQLLKAFRQSRTVPEGELRITALAEEHIPAATDLLATSFADAVGYIPMYRGLLKQEVQQYLKSHLNIAPKAVILVAVLEQPAEVSESAADVSSPGDNLSTMPLELICLRQVSALTAAVGAQDSSDSPERQSALSDDSDGSEQSIIGNPLQPDGLLPSRIRGALSALDSPSEESEAEESVPEPLKSTSESRADAESSSLDNYSSFSDEKADSLRLSGSDRPEDSERERGGSSSNGNSRPGSSTNGSDDELEEASCAQSRGEVVGTVELSFSTSTRTPSVTLNPPQDAAYLCNMAVSEHHQRRGYGSHLLAAAEEVVRLAGFRRVYLHVRLKDEAAKALYRKGGFEVEREDCVLVSLWDHRRQLLSKFLPRSQMQLQTAAVEPEEPLEPVESEF